MNTKKILFSIFLVGITYSLSINAMDGSKQVAPTVSTEKLSENIDKSNWKIKLKSSCDSVVVNWVLFKTASDYSGFFKKMSTSGTYKDSWEKESDALIVFEGFSHATLENFAQCMGVVEALQKTFEIKGEDADEVIVPLKKFSKQELSDLILLADYTDTPVIKRFAAKKLMDNLFKDIPDNKRPSLFYDDPTGSYIYSLGEVMEEVEAIKQEITSDVVMSALMQEYFYKNFSDNKDLEKEDILSSFDLHPNFSGHRVGVHKLHDPLFDIYKETVLVGIDTSLDRLRADFFLPEKAFLDQNFTDYLEYCFVNKQKDFIDSYKKYCIDVVKKHFIHVATLKNIEEHFLDGTIDAWMKKINNIDIELLLFERLEDFFKKFIGNEFPSNDQGRALIKEKILNLFEKIRSGSGFNGLTSILLGGIFYKVFDEIPFEGVDFEGLLGLSQVNSVFDGENYATQDLRLSAFRLFFFMDNEHIDVVKKISFPNCQFTQIPDFLHYFPNLEELDLTGNNFTELPQFIKDHPKIKVTFDAKQLVAMMNNK